MAIERMASPRLPVAPDEASLVLHRSDPAALWLAALSGRAKLAVALLTLALVTIAVGWPAVAGGVLGLGAAACFALALRDLTSADFACRVHGPLGPPLRPEVEPEDVEAAPLRGAYLALLSAHEELRVTLTESKAVTEVLRELYARCGDLVQAAGRCARNGNPLSAYLAEQSPALADSPQRFERLGIETGDQDAARAYRHAASISRQHLQLNRQILGLYERIEARLAAATTFLSVVRALAVKLQAVDVEHVQAADSRITDSVNELRDELEILESSLETALAASP
jgi:hypothetical protein